MKFKKWISTTAAAILLASSFSTATIANAAEAKTIADESMYDLLVDRFFNASGFNDENINPQDPTQFAGGDFQGLNDKIDFISKMGYTIVSIGSVFATEKYDGSMVTSYNKIEPHFGSSKEFDKVIKTYDARNIRIMVDFPLNNISENHEWAQDSAKKNWFSSIKDNRVQLDYSNVDVQVAILETIVNFVKEHQIGGLRLTNLGSADTAFINQIIHAVKEVNKDIYIVSNESSDAAFDATFSDETNQIYRDIFKNVGRDSSAVIDPINAYLEGQEKPAQLMIDTLNTARFTFDSASENEFPPTRIKMALATLMTLPGIPVVQYGTEIAMNGEMAPDAHQLYNFKVEEEIMEYIGDVQSIRNKSETLRNGKYELVKNENGFLVYKRTSADETWIIVVNNTNETQRIDFTEEDLGKGKEVRGLFESDIIRADKDGHYRLVVDREIVELYQVIDEKGLNISYLVALAFVFIGFVVFVIFLTRRGNSRNNIQE